MNLIFISSTILPFQQLLLQDNKVKNDYYAV